MFPSPNQIISIYICHCFWTDRTTDREHEEQSRMYSWFPLSLKRVFSTSNTSPHRQGYLSIVSLLSLISISDTCIRSYTSWYACFDLISESYNALDSGSFRTEYASCIAEILFIPIPSTRPWDTCLSGWTAKRSDLYACLISSSVALGEIHRVW
jgi:hypothetical protein